MEPNASVKAEERTEYSSKQAESSKDASLLGDIQALWGELQGLGHDHFSLAALEARRAGQTLTMMLATAVMLGLLLSTAWLGLLAAGVQWLIEHNFQASSAILLAVAGNLLLALMLIGVIRRSSRFLQFPATQRSLVPPSTERHTKDSR
ncbi:MAG: hypothetical protein BVN35_00665 [Proteobacteria bacterium ST_bin11]|nr:MAG: hypothetical protein BVN35_00665 [Proteobacteria bacterium ST_bin11]